MEIKNLEIGNAPFIKELNAYVFETGKHYGNMNTAAAFYPKEFTPKERRESFLNSRLNAGRDNGFDGHKFYMASQTDKTGTYKEITKDIVEAAKDGWDIDIPEDILITTNKIPGIVIGHPIADCPVVMSYDRKNNAVAIAHCSADLVDKKMPMLVQDALLDSKNTRDEDIVTYISSGAGTSWTYDSYPKWATDNKVWDGFIKYNEKSGLYYIDVKGAIKKQLEERNIKNVITSKIDTITDDRFYSNSAAFNGDETKKGRNFAGAYFKVR